MRPRSGRTARILATRRRLPGALSGPAVYATAGLQGPADETPGRRSRRPQAKGSPAEAGAGGGVDDGIDVETIDPVKIG